MATLKMIVLMTRWSLTPNDGNDNWDDDEYDDNGNDGDDTDC